ncbi:MAG: hypothetical protein JWR77_1752, partial [Rhizorhabdus sp.]|nr:hypothetical protein [Rhizorhabdus sp.]
IFYATTISLALLGAGGGLNATLAWIYVALRIAHSLVQALVNIVLLRFAIFMAASLVLLILGVRAAIILFAGPAA